MKSDVLSLCIPQIIQNLLIALLKFRLLGCLSNRVLANLLCPVELLLRIVVVDRIVEEAEQHGRIGEFVQDLLRFIQVQLRIFETLELHVGVRYVGCDDEIPLASELLHLL